MNRNERHARNLANWKFLGELRRGDRVIYGVHGREYAWTVSRELRPADEVFGSWESSRITVCATADGYSGYSTEVTVEGLTAGYYTLGRESQEGE